MNTSLRSNSAISRSFDLLEVVSRYLRPVSIQELSLELDVPRQSAHRLVAQLEAIGAVVREPGTDRFSVGVRMRSLSFACISSYQQTSESHNELKRLVDIIGETCNIGMLDGNEVVYLDRVECDWPLRVQLRAGSRVPAYCTAIGKLLLANSDCRTQQKFLDGTDLLRLTEHTIVDPEVLKSEFGEIVSRGYSLNEEEDSAGLIAIAVPIRDSAGNVVAGLGVHAPIARMSIKQAQEFLPKIRATAEKISNIVF